MTVYGYLDERGRPRCPACDSKTVQALGGRGGYRCTSAACAERGTAAREFRIRAADLRAADRAVEAKHARLAADRERWRVWLDRYGTRPRTQSHRLLRSDRELRALWNAVRAAKTRPALIRRGQAFVDALTERAFDVGDDEWQTTLRWGRDGLHQTRTRWRSHAPVVSAANLSGLGVYSRTIHEGHKIRLDVAKHTDLDELRRTLVHEVQHFLDHVTGIDDEAHGRRWHSRLAELEAMFPCSHRATAVSYTWGTSHDARRTPR